MPELEKATPQSCLVAAVIGTIVATVPGFILAVSGFFGWVVMCVLAWPTSEVVSRVAKRPGGRRLQVAAAAATLIACILASLLGEFATYYAIKSELVESFSEILNLYFSVHLSRIEWASLVSRPVIPAIFASGIIAGRQRRLRAALGVRHAA